MVTTSSLSNEEMGQEREGWDKKHIVGGKVVAGECWEAAWKLEEGEETVEDGKPGAHNTKDLQRDYKHVTEFHILGPT